MEEEFEKIKAEEQRLRMLETFNSYKGADEVITSTEAWKNLEEKRKQKTPKFFSKIPTLDALIDGFREGDVVVVSGPTKMGKTTFCQTLTTNLAQSNINCLWFSYEMAPQEFLEKFGESLPFFALPKTLKGNSLEWIESKIIEAIAKYDTKVAIIDHLHFLVDMSFIGQKGNVSLLIGSIMRKLKQIALEWNIAIVLIAHTTKIDFEKEPDLSDIRDSSFISQEADTTLMIYRAVDKETKMYGDKAILAVLANRRTGKVGKIVMQLVNGKFVEIAKNYEPKMDKPSKNLEETGRIGNKKDEVRDYWND